MHILQFDNTFEGLLTLVFDCFEQKLEPDEILAGEGAQNQLFATTHTIHTDERKAERVWNGLVKKTSPANGHRVYRVFLSELPEMPLLLYRYLHLMFSSPRNEESNFANEWVLRVNQLHQKVTRETHRVQMFTRFQQTADGNYFAAFRPQYNVLPLCIPHFKDRFADQPWIIYDLQRDFGFWNDLTDLTRITFSNLKVNPATGQLPASLLNDDEQLFQQLWKKYFDNIAIPERRNLKLHRQLLPKRFWNYLPEKRTR